MNYEKLDTEISFFLEKNRVELGIVISDGQKLYKKFEYKKFPAASLIKLFILGAVCNLIESQKVEESKKIRIQNEDLVWGSGIIKYSKGNISLSVSELIYLMVSYSDNIATNKLLQLISIQEVQKFIDLLGAINTKISVPMMPSKELFGNKFNTTTALDIYLFYKFLISIEPIQGVHFNCAKKCIEVFKKSVSKKNILQKYSSKIFFLIFLKTIYQNPKFIINYLKAYKFANRKRISRSFPDNSIVAEKSATGKTVYHDTCLIKIKGDKKIIIYLTKMEDADFSKSNSNESRVLLDFFCNLNNFIK